MQKRMTIKMDEVVYERLMRVAERGKVRQLLKALARPHVTDTAMDEGYRAMGRDQFRKVEASEWIHGLISDTAQATR